MTKDSTASPGGARVLLLEDEMLVSMILEDALELGGYEVVGPVAKVDHALALINDGEPFDAAVMDLNLGGHSAIPVADVLAVRRIPFLVVTGYGGAALSPPHQDVPVLAKPFSPSELIAAVHRLLTPPSEA
ncbi:response regulator [Parapusillimonas sp. SGNA-6]|nr:response regulator [Parapusillimonas sp. SGNA-6]